METNKRAPKNIILCSKIIDKRFQKRQPEAVNEKFQTFNNIMS